MKNKISKKKKIRHFVVVASHMRCLRNFVELNGKVWVVIYCFLKNQHLEGNVLPKAMNFVLAHSVARNLFKVRRWIIFSPESYIGSSNPISPEFEPDWVCLSLLRCVRNYLNMWDLRVVHPFIGPSDPHITAQKLPDRMVF